MAMKTIVYLIANFSIFITSAEEVKRLVKQNIQMATQEFEPSTTQLHGGGELAAPFSDEWYKFVGLATRKYIYNISSNKLTN